MIRLRIEIPDQPESMLELGEHGISIGRDPANDLSHDAPWLSRFHASIAWDGKRHLLEDRGSRNGTYLNGGRLKKALPLVDRDVITVGNLQIFYLAAEGDEGEDGDEHTPLPEGSTVLIRSQELSFERYRQATRDQIESSERSLMPALHAAASALIHHYPLGELGELVLGLARDAVGAERGALLLRPRRTRPLKVRRSSIPRRPGSAEGIRPSSSPDRTKSRETRVETGTLEIPSFIGGLQVSASAGYGAEEVVQISRTILSQVVQEERAVLTLDAQADERFGHSLSIQMEGIRSIICVPLWNDREVIGALYLDHRMAHRQFSEQDLRLAGLLANMAAVKIQNVYLLEEQIEKQRLEEQLSVGSKIQRRLLPAGSPRIPGYDLHGHNRSCDEVGGDYFDFIKKGDGRLAVVIADVAGKGVGAALLMAVLQASLRALAGTSETPDALVGQINRVLVESSPANKFATLFYGELDLETHTLEYVNGGHVPPGLLRTPFGKIEELLPTGPSVGMFPEVTFESRKVKLAPDSTLLLCTDGVTELIDGRGEEFGRPRLREFLAAKKEPSALALAEDLEARLASFRGRRGFSDDSTVVILRRVG